MLARPAQYLPHSNGLIEKLLKIRINNSPHLRFILHPVLGFVPYTFYFVNLLTHGCICMKKRCALVPILHPCGLPLLLPIRFLVSVQFLQGPVQIGNLLLRLRRLYTSLNSISLLWVLSISLFGLLSLFH